tara:strand:- start:6212 stop:6487 length:276 start_codon:yes stop_codon:yes gene_type:complete
MIDKRTARAIRKVIGAKHIQKIVDFANEINFVHGYKNEDTLKAMVGYSFRNAREIPHIELLIKKCAKHYKDEKLRAIEANKEFVQELQQSA